MFSPMTSNMEERLELIKNSMSKEIATEELAKCESLEDFYHFSNQVRNGVFAQMQLYVLENYEKLPIEEWNKHSFKITHHLGKEETRFGKKDKFKHRWKIEAMMKMEKKIYDQSIKTTSISFTLDEHDGEFSVQFNEDCWSFLWEDEIVTYYYTIKGYLKYLSLREERNQLRDKFEKATSVLESGKLKEQIKKLDTQLTRYEKV